MRQRARTDSNQIEIVAALRAAGMTVKDCSKVGQGFPDLCVGWRGMTFLLETKGIGHAHRALSPGEPDLTAAQQEFHGTWGGHLAVASSPQEAVDKVILAAVTAGAL